MRQKLLKKGDLKILRDEQKKGVLIAPSEIKRVINKVGEVAYVLYSVYRTVPFRESSEIADSNVAAMIGWAPRKVGKYRNILESNDLVLTRRYGTKEDGITKFFVGEVQVALFNAGLPADVVNPTALRKIMDTFNMQDTFELIKDVDMVCMAYERNPESFK